MVDKTSFMFITGPEVIKSVTREEVTQEDLGGGATHNSRSGVAHFLAPDDRGCIDMIRKLLGYLPSNNMEDPPVVATNDPAERSTPELDDLIPDNPAIAVERAEGWQGTAAIAEFAVVVVFDDPGIILMRVVQ